MNDWYGTAKGILADVDRNLPADADLHTRHQACLRAKPHEFHVTSWGRKVWARAQREYLAKYGYVPKNAGVLPESPLERAMRRAER